ncbi:translocation and assembly module protein TamB [Rhodobacteraceae bacterium]|nr:translocation and assembly module protein TamB [Paracoccaceae bacterium]
MIKKLAIVFIVLWPMTGFAQDATGADTSAPAGAAAPAQSDRDRSYLTGLIEDKLSGEGRTIRLDGFKGALSSRATFETLTISDSKGPWLVIRNAGLQWNRSALLRGEVDIKELSADEIELSRLPEPAEGVDLPPAEAKPFSLPELPVSIDVGKLDVKKVTLGKTVIGQPLEFSANGSVRLAGGDGQAELNITRTDDVSGEFSLKASYENDTQALSVDLLAQEGQGGLVSGLIGLPGEPPVTLAVAGDGPLSDFSADISLATDGQQRLTGKVSLADRVPEEAPAGTAPDKTFVVKLSGDLTPMLDAQYHSFFGNDVRLDVEGALKPSGGIELSQLDMKAEAVDLHGSVILLPSRMPDVIDLDVNVGLASGEQVVLPVSGGETTLANAALKLSYDRSQGDGWSLKGQVAQLVTQSMALKEVRLEGSGQITQNTGQDPAVDGSVLINGTGIEMSDPDLAEAVGPFLTAKTVFSWQKGAPLRLSQLRAIGRDYGVEGQVQFQDLAKGLDIATKATIRHDDLSRLSGVSGRPLSGSVRGDVDGTFTALAGAFDANIDLTGQDLTVGQPQADAALAGTSKITLSAKRDETGITLRSFTADARALTAQASGTLATGRSQIDATARADLSVLGAGYGGSVTTEASYTESDEGRRVKMNAIGQNVSIGQAQADRLMSGRTVIDLDVLEKDGQITINQLNVDNPHLTASADGQIADGAGQINAKVDGDLSGLGGGYRGRLNATATLSAGADGNQIDLRATTNNLGIGQSQADRLLAGQTVLQVQALQNGTTIQLQDFQLNNPQLTASAKGRIADGNRQIDMNARLNNLALLAPGFPGAVSVNGQVRDNGTQYALDINATGPANTRAAVSGTLASNFAKANLRLNGSTQSALANAFIEPRSVEGPLQFDLALNGPLALNSLSGTISGSGLRVSAPTLGLALQDMAVNANLSGGRLNLDTNARFEDGGRLSVTGPITLSAPFNAQLNIALDRARLRDPNLYDTRVTGQIGVNGALTGGARITGDLALADTEIRVPSTGLGGIEDIPDIDHVAESAQTRQTRERAGLLKDTGGGESGSGGGAVYPLDITIRAPNQIFVRGRGLDAELGGELRLTGTTANIVPIGTFDLVRGRLDVLTQRFTLDQGSISLQGNFVPYINFAATTTKSDYAITLSIYGDANEPELSVSSAPELPQEEVLAQLLFGRGLENISALQAAQLASAVATLAGRNDNGIMSRLRNSTGLDDLNVGTDDEGNATVTAGKYISDKLYTDVELGTGGQTEIHLNLDISDSVTARGSVGSDGNSGIGLFVEKDY